eukprot:scaffold15414_cov114-Isochrysis_galbana.AAC.2
MGADRACAARGGGCYQLPTGDPLRPREPVQEEQKRVAMIPSDGPQGRQGAQMRRFCSTAGHGLPRAAADWPLAWAVGCARGAAIVLVV